MYNNIFDFVKDNPDLHGVFCTIEWADKTLEEVFFSFMPAADVDDVWFDEAYDSNVFYYIDRKEFAPGFSVSKEWTLVG